jgi:hypothetical protein
MVYLYLSPDFQTGHYVTSSLIGEFATASLPPNSCLTSSTDWLMDAYDANGCRITNFDINYLLNLPAQVTAQNIVCYSPTPEDPQLCGCESQDYRTFYISSSDTTDANALYSNYTDLYNNGTKIYDDCKLSSLALGAYYGYQNVVSFGTGPTAGTIVNIDPCLVPQPNTVTINIVNSQKTTSTTNVSTTFESTNPNTHVYELLSFNEVTSSVYNIAQTGFIDITAYVSEALSDPGYIIATVNISQDGQPPLNYYYNCYVGLSSTFYINGIFIDSDSYYTIDINYSAGYGPNCSETPPE